MGLISKLGVGLAILVMMTGGCAEAKGPEAGVQDSQPRIMTMDYNAATNSAVMELCRMANVGSLPGVRDCHLVRADFNQATEGGVLAVTAVADAPGYKTSLPVFTPAGDAVYAVRRRSEDWERRKFRSASQIVRIDLATGRIDLIAEAASGSLSVAEVLGVPGEAEQLVILETLGFSDRGLPRGSRVLTLTVRDGQVVDGSRHVFADLGGRGFDLSISGLGYVKGAVERRDGAETRTRFMALRAEDLREGRYVLRDDLTAATAYAAGCDGSGCAVGAPRRALDVAAAVAGRPAYDTAHLRGVEIVPENVVVEFEGRPAAWYPDPEDPYGAFRVDYDLSGGALVTPLGPQADPGRVRFTIMGGEVVPFRPVMSGYLDLAGYAAGKL